MGAFDFNVLPAKGQRVPVDVAGSVMVNVQGLLREIGKSIVVRELHLQDDVPEDLLSRFTIYVDGAGMNVSSSADIGLTGPDALLKAALMDLIDLLNDVIDERHDTILEKYPDPRNRGPILNCVLSLSEGLGGLGLSFGGRDEERTFKDVNKEWLVSLIEDGSGSFMGDVTGILKRDGESAYLETDIFDLPLDFNGSLPFSDDHERLFNRPCTVSGNIILSDDGFMESISEIYGLDELPYISFEKVISSERCIDLSGPLVANVDHDADNDLWTLSNEPLGVTVSKNDLDDAILEFHDHFVFIWEMYAEDIREDAKDDLSEEEIELRDYVLSFSRTH